MADESSGSFYRKTNRDANKFIDTRRPARRRAVRVSPRVHRLCPPFYAHSSFVGADNDQLLLLLLHWLHFHEYVYTFPFFFSFSFFTTTCPRKRRDDVGEMKNR